MTLNKIVDFDSRRSGNNSWQLILMHALLSTDKGTRKVVRAGLMKCAVLLEQIRSGILDKAPLAPRAR